MEGEPRTDDETALTPRPDDAIFEDDDDDDEEEVLFILPAHLLKGQRKYTSATTSTNRDSYCSYDSEASSGFSDKDKSLSPAPSGSTKTTSYNEKQVKSMGSTATSCQYGTSNTNETFSSLNQVKQNGRSSTEDECVIEKRNKRDNGNNENGDRVDGCDPTYSFNGESDEDLKIKITNGKNRNRDNASELIETVGVSSKYDETIEVDYVNVSEHIPPSFQKPPKACFGNHNVSPKANSLPPKPVSLQDELNQAMDKQLNRSQSENGDSSKTTPENGINENKQHDPLTHNCSPNADHVDSSQVKCRTIQVGDSPTKSQTSDCTPKVGERRVTYSKGTTHDDGRREKGPVPDRKGAVANVPGAARKPVYSFDEAVDILKENIQVLLKLEDFTQVHGRAELKFVRRTTRYSSDVHLNKRLVDSLVKNGIIHVFLCVWKSVSTVDFMNYAENLNAFKNLQTALSIIWNCTDKSPQLCASLVTTGALLSFVEELGSERVSGSDLSHENNLYLVKAYLGILHNVVRLCSESRRIFRATNAVKILQWYLINKNDLIKTNAYLVLSYVITEEENDVINANDDNIKFIVGVLKDALNSENHFSKMYGFWALEVVSGLNHLAVNDSNKVRIGTYGALTLYMRLLQDGSEEEKSQAVSGLWILAFKDENKFLLRDEPGYLEVLSKLTVAGSTENIRRAARGTLWVVQSLQEKPATQTIEDADIPHVMVSYHHKSGQKMMLKVVRRLRQAGYKIWMDLDDMHGSTLEAMALAIERSCCILVCMTQGYKDSPSCRTEAEYTYRLRKDIIPLLGQDGYVPDGWLGAFVGSRLHFDFSADDKIPIEIQKLVRELGTRGKLPTRKICDRRSVQTSSDSFDGLTWSTSWSTCSSSGHSYHQKHSTSQWSTDDVRSWLESHMLGHISDRFDTMNGELILQLKVMQKVAPEFFYSTLEHKLKLDLVTVLKFTRALEDVF